MTKYRRICWPLFDKVCLEGGCLYCNDSSLRSISEIEKKCEESDELMTAFKWGQDHEWGNAKTRGR